MAKWVSKPTLHFAKCLLLIYFEYNCYACRLRNSIIINSDKPTNSLSRIELGAVAVKRPD